LSANGDVVPLRADAGDYRGPLASATAGPDDEGEEEPGD
jgi:hypothetical protein